MKIIITIIFGIILNGCCYTLKLERIDSPCEELLKERNQRVMELLVEKDSLQTELDKRFKQWLEK